MPALVAERSTSIFAPFLTDDVQDRPPEEFLLKLGARYLEIVTTPDALVMYRLVVAEISARKEVAELFWRSGPGHARVLLSRYFAIQVKHQMLKLDDPDQAARDFIGLLLGTMHMECVLRLRSKPAPAEIEASVRNVVRLFLDGCRVANSG